MFDNIGPGTTISAIVAGIAVALGLIVGVHYLLRLFA
jgi:hypothetical protein